jgi:hypothetical protein
MCCTTTSCSHRPVVRRLPPPDAGQPGWPAELHAADAARAFFWAASTFLLSGRKP